MITRRLACARGQSYELWFATVLDAISHSLDRVRRPRRLNVLLVSGQIRARDIRTSFTAHLPCNVLSLSGLDGYAAAPRFDISHFDVIVCEATPGRTGAAALFTQRCSRFYPCLKILLMMDAPADTEGVRCWIEEARFDAVYGSDDLVERCAFPAIDFRPVPVPVPAETESAAPVSGALVAGVERVIENYVHWSASGAVVLCGGRAPLAGRNRFRADPRGWFGRRRGRRHCRPGGVWRCRLPPSRWSLYLTQALDPLGGFGGKAERIARGVPTRRFNRCDATALRASLGLGGDQRITFSLKILQPLYRVHLVVEAMAILVRRFPPAVLLISEYRADPDYKIELEQQIAALALQQHTLLRGSIKHNDMPLYYTLAELCVSVPSSDGLPQSLLESMACVSPSTLIRLPRYEEFEKHEDSAYFAAPDSIAGGMARPLRDPALHARMAEEALDIVRREGDLDAQARQVERRYRQLAASVRPHVIGVSGLLSTWRSSHRFRNTAREADGTGVQVAG